MQGDVVMDKCNYCESTVGLEWHHIIPKSMGGSDDANNLLRVCNDHHAVLHNISKRGNISSLTKAALQQLKAKGVQLGNLQSLEAHRARGSASTAAKAKAFAVKLKPTIEALRSGGMTLAQIAEHLNDDGILTSRGCYWSHSSLSRLIKMANKHND